MSEEKVLVDASVWIDHLHSAHARLSFLLAEDLVLVHSGVIGEIACGHLRRRSEVVARLQRLPRAIEASATEALNYIERYQLHGQGFGWVDVQLLASAALTGARLWTFDKCLARAAERLGAKR